MRGATGGDDVEFAVAIEVGEGEVFAGGFLINDGFAPLLAFYDERGPNG